MQHLSDVLSNEFVFSVYNVVEYGFRIDTLYKPENGE